MRRAIGKTLHSSVPDSAHRVRRTSNVSTGRVRRAIGGLVLGVVLVDAPYEHVRGEVLGLAESNAMSRAPRTDCTGQARFAFDFARARRREQQEREIKPADPQGWYSLVQLAPDLRLIGGETKSETERDVDGLRVLSEKRPRALREQRIGCGG